MNPCYFSALLFFTSCILKTITSQAYPFCRARLRLRTPFSRFPRSLVFTLVVSFVETVRNEQLFENLASQPPQFRRREAPRELHAFRAKRKRP
jgi:hypothetical protein